MKNFDWIDQSKPIAVAGSLLLIKDAQSKLRDMGDTTTSPEAIASRIRLCNVLLYEIRDIRARLEHGLQARRPSARSGSMVRDAIN